MKSDDISEIEKEVKILSKLEHTNIVSFIGLKEVNNETYMIMEYMNSGDLLTYLRTNESTLKEPDLFGIAKQVCSGMEYLEENKIIHK